MDKILLKDVTLLGIDCIDIERLIFAAEISQKNIQFGRVKLLTHLPYTNHQIVKIDPISSIEQYSKFMIKELYKYVDTKFVLVIQWDGFVLNPSNWSDDFLRYDYIGAAWHHKDNYNVGNGGFSLRSRHFLECIAFDHNINIYHPEDFVICRTFGKYLKAKGIKFADEVVASRFSVENKKWKNQFGFHCADISDWAIQKFADKNKHLKYINQFYQLFQKPRKE